MASGIDEATEKSAKIADRKNLKFNYIVNTGDGAFYAMAMGMVPLTTVITYFVSGFVSQKWLIGLLSSLNILLMCSPQILVSKKLEKLRYYKPFMIFTGLLLRLLWLLLGLDVILLANKNPRLFIILFYVIYSLIGLVAAFVGISWLNFIVKIIPDEVRGRFLGIRSTIAGVCESTGALLMGIIIKRFPYPFNYGVLFVTVFVVTMISISILSLSREHEWEKEIKEDENKSYLSKMSYVLKTDSNFANYLISVALISGLGKMAFAFQIIFAKEKLGIMDQQLSYATFILLAAIVLGILYGAYWETDVDLSRLWKFLQSYFYLQSYLLI